MRQEAVPTRQGGLSDPTRQEPVPTTYL